MNRRKTKDAAEELIEVVNPADVPEFASEEEEAAFWDTHCLGAGWRLEPGEEPALPLPPVDPSRVHERRGARSSYSKQSRPA